jgi:hypothetical protein
MFFKYFHIAYFIQLVCLEEFDKSVCSASLVLPRLPRISQAGMGHCILEEMHHSIGMTWRIHLFLFITMLNLLVVNLTYLKRYRAPLAGTELPLINP